MLLPTGQPLPLHGIHFVDELRGWAVGDFGSVLHTADGGKSWKVQRRGGQRAAVLFVHARPAGLPVDTIAELSHHPNIIGMKDSSGNIEKLKETVGAVKPGFQVTTGAAGSLWEALHLGATGAILALANPLPYTCVTIWEAFRTREHEAGKDWQSRIQLASHLSVAKYGIPALKYAMDLNGYYGGPPRLPFVPPSAEIKAEIEQAFDGLRG